MTATVFHLDQTGMRGNGREARGACDGQPRPIHQGHVPIDVRRPGHHRETGAWIANVVVRRAQKRADLAVLDTAVMIYVRGTAQGRQKLVGEHPVTEEIPLM